MTMLGTRILEISLGATIWKWKRGLKMNVLLKTKRLELGKGHGNSGAKDEAVLHEMLLMLLRL